LQKLLDERHGKGFVRDPTPCIAYLSRHIQDSPALDQADVERFVARDSGQLALLGAMGPDHWFLPADLQQRSVRRASAIDLAAQVIRIARLRWQAPATEEFRRRAPNL
jgi:hypothetical protein